MVGRRRDSWTVGSSSQQTRSSTRPEDSSSSGHGISSQSRNLQGSSLLPRRSSRVAHQLQNQQLHRDDHETLDRRQSQRRPRRSHANEQRQVEPGESSHQASRSASQSTSTPIQFAIAFVRQPPAEIRTGYILPAFIVSLRVVDANLQGQPSPIEPGGSINAVATIVTADGQDPVTSQGNLIIMHPMTATAPERHFNVSSDTEWTFEFVASNNGISIQSSGHFRIKIVLINTPTVTRSDGVAEVDSPIQLMSITSHVIHVHPFAPLVRG